MISRRRIIASTGALIGTSAVVAACGNNNNGQGTGTGLSAGSSGSAASASSGGGSPTADVNPGGIANLEQQAAFEYLDPQQIYVNNSSAFARLIYRTLMAWKEDPATGKYELVPDLAADMPTNADGGKTWTFKLKPGIKYMDGTAITAADLKYGVERSMDAQISNGPQYAKLYLLGADKYTGPTKGPLASIEAPDATTITFKLSQPVGYWDQLCTMYTFTPVPRAKDTGAKYDLSPVTMGPYKFQQYDKQSKIVLVKDTNWAAATDPLRTQNFQQIVCLMGLDLTRIDNDLIQDTNGGTNVMFSDDPAPAAINRVTQAPLKSRTLTGTTIFIDYLGIQQNQPALKKPEVRQAILYALDPKASIQALGGPLLRAPIQSFAPPTLKGFEDIKDRFDIGETGNPDKAKQLLQQAGVSNLTLTYAHANTPVATKVAQTIVAALARAGIKVVPKPIEASAYYKTVSTLSNKYDLLRGGWGYDIPDGSTIYPPIFQGGANLYNGTSNLSQLNDPHVNDLIKQALAKPSTDAALPLWQEIDKYIVEQALVIPRFLYKVAPIMGSKVKGVYISPVLGNADIANAYISKT